MSTFRRFLPFRRAFNQMVRQVGPNKYEVVPEFRREYKLVVRPDMGGLRLSARGAVQRCRPLR